MKRTAILLTCAAMLLLDGAATVQSSLTVTPNVIGGGGGHAEVSPYVLDATIGQAVTGVDDAARYEICAGFWCSVTMEYWVYLPLVLRTTE